MDDPGLARLREAVRELSSVERRLVGGLGPADLAHRPALDEFHREKTSRLIPDDMVVTMTR